MSQIASVFEGKEAVQRFLYCLNSFFQDDATGQAYAVTRDAELGLNMVPLTGCAIEAIALDAQKDVSLLTDYNMIVIDSGNRGFSGLASPVDVPTVEAFPVEFL